MKPITLFKPVVLRSSLNDMVPSHRETAFDLLDNHKVLMPGKDGLRFIQLEKEQHKKFPKFYLYGSEAVCYYRQSLGLPDVSIKDIDVDDIVMETEDFNALFDILFFLHNIHMRNERISYLNKIDAPPVIMWNEYRMLQQYVETLQDNNWCGHPVTNRFNAAGEDEEPEWREEARKSLTDIGYSLLEFKKCSEPIPAE